MLSATGYCETYDSKLIRQTFLKYKVESHLSTQDNLSANKGEFLLSSTGR